VFARDRPSTSVSRLPSSGHRRGGEARAKRTPACHAGGRGFESRRSRRNTLPMGIFCCPFWRNRPPALRSVTRAHPARESGRDPVSVKPCKSACSVAGHEVGVLGHPAAIPQANRPAVLGGADWDYEWPEASCSAGCCDVAAQLSVIALTPVLCRACWSLLHPWIVRRVGVYGRAAVINGFGAQFVVPGFVAVDLA
jgi:hypothetical protein